MLIAHLAYEILILLYWAILIDHWLHPWKFAFDHGVNDDKPIDHKEQKNRIDGIIVHIEELIGTKYTRDDRT